MNRNSGETDILGKAAVRTKDPNAVQAFFVSVFFWFTLFFISGLLFPISFLIFLLTFAFDRNLLLLHRYSCLWSWIILSVNPYWKVRIVGREKIDRKVRYVMVSNHASGADIMVLFKLFADFKWVAKKGLFIIPFIGWNMMLNRYIPIERSKGRSKMKMMDKAVESIRNGNSVMIFPEGTRTRDGNLQPFKSGAFRLALETQSPILPIAIKGTYHAIKKGGLRVHKNYNIRAVVLDPIPYADFRDLEVIAITRKVHDLILEELGR
jgi:1-acyl-sn-glycerol-3-phosphate acyltransferase